MRPTSRAAFVAFVGVGALVVAGSGTIAAGPSSRDFIVDGLTLGGAVYPESAVYTIVADAKRRVHPVGGSGADADNRLSAVGRRGQYSVAKLLEKHGDARLTDLRHTLANCPKARSTTIYDRCKVVYEGL
jgi:hypothetical protein